MGEGRQGWIGGGKRRRWVLVMSVACLRTIKQRCVRLGEIECYLRFEMNPCCTHGDEDATASEPCHYFYGERGSSSFPFAYLFNMLYSFK